MFEWMSAVLLLSIVGIAIASLAGLLLGVPLVAVLGRLGAANVFTITIAGVLAGFAIYMAWIVVPAMDDGDESFWSIIAGTMDSLAGFSLSGGFAAAAFWFGAKPRISRR